MKAFHRRNLKLEDINERVRTDPAGFVREESERFQNEIYSLAEFLSSSECHKLVMLSGPSSSGKTTTALLIRDRLREIGVDAYSISMDNFYRGRDQAPRLADGTYDYEALEALRLDDLEKCMRELIEDGKTNLPTFDFQAGSPSPETDELRIQKNSVVIFEGIHAINPYFEKHLPSESVFKVFVNTVSPIYGGDLKLLARREIRLTRRMLRDERFRNSPVVNTLDMWQQVIRGENMYMFPYVDTVDYLIDTTHAYEPCVFAPLLLPDLKKVPDSDGHSDAVRHLARALAEFAPLSLEYMPKNALLREFVGDGIY